MRNQIARQAITESIARDEVVTIEWNKNAFEYFRSLCGFYTLTSVGYQFDGGDECARNDWTVVVEKRK